MKRSALQISVIVIVSVFIGCSVPPPTIDEPVSEDTYIVMGAVILEDDYFTNFPTVYLGDIEVAILAEYVEDGIPKTAGYWARTDENGYFYLANVPPGRYALTGIKVFLNDQTWLVISNPLTEEDSDFEVNFSDHIGFIGSYFDIRPRGRIVNLQNNYFSVDSRSRGYGDVKYLRRRELRGLRLVNGLSYDLIPAEKYFIRQFGNSGWADIIREYR